MNNDHFGLAMNFRVSPNSCDNPSHYEQYLQFSAISDGKSGMGVTHLAVEKDDDTDEVKAVLGFVTVRATSLLSKGENGEDRVHPSLEIAELAVSKNYERQGVGTKLVDLAIAMADEMRERYMGIKYIVLCADPKAVGFYEKLDFKAIGDDMEFINVDDEDGSISLALMPNIYEQFKDYVHEGDYITFKGNHDREGSVNVKGLKVLKDDKNSNS